MAREALHADPLRLTRATHVVRQAALEDRRAPGPIRSVIGASWRRMRLQGLSPAGAPEIAPLPGEELLRRREGSGLQPLMPLLRQHLLPACEATGQLMVVADVEGRVLWREGQVGVLRHADHLGFVGGSAWTEGNVGTNAIGTCLVTEAPVHIHAAEHYAQSHTPWTCAAAPLRDPATGRVLGVVDLSGPVHTVHAGTLSMVTLAARLAELEIRAATQERLHGLRAIAAPLLARLDGRALVVASDGTTAAATGLVPPDRVALPIGFGGEDAWVAGFGLVTAEPLPGGWLLRIKDDDGEEQISSMTLDLSSPDPVVRLTAAGSTWAHALTPRHGEILLTLLLHPGGRSAAEIADDLFADPTRVVTVRAEISRLRKVLGSVIARQPYRMAQGVRSEIIAPPEGITALARSSAPVVTRWRAGIVTD
ncbi:diguanylate cyclase [Aeromicrobium sp. A1-2]|uniref:helix-turn-helix domain-containing protein n=1 Tax=Aeromicrobium sp. A1-2 TaxID=2107713 RepID=UPI000E4D16E6|nr:helix-turn-helix domain-containing protein [Aeromicrobium sp. A1-2]AXT86547.1 diguanylate cyclase [Aeromicrobium sp. A1-2]